eukprot:81190-Alexandrium_andersonii.AAC.1
MADTAEGGAAGEHAGQSRGKVSCKIVAVQLLTGLPPKEVDAPMIQHLAARGGKTPGASNALARPPAP